MPRIPFHKGRGASRRAPQSDSRRLYESAARVNHHSPQHGLAALRTPPAPATRTRPRTPTPEACLKKRDSHLARYHVKFCSGKYGPIHFPASKPNLVLRALQHPHFTLQRLPDRCPPWLLKHQKAQFV